MNISELLIDNGFEVTPKDFNPKNNWFGVSLYCPYVKFTKVDYKVELSLQSAAIMPDYYTVQEHRELFEAKKSKYIGFYNSNKVMYKSWTGIMPSNEFVDEFIKLSNK